MTRRAQTPDDLRDGPIMGPHGPLRDMGVYGEGVADAAGPGASGRVGSGPISWVDADAAGVPEARVTSETGDVAGVLSPVWRTGTVVGLLGVVIGVLMIVGTSGLAAVVLWPLGALSIISGASVLWATHQARRASRRMNVHVTRVRMTRTWQ